MKFMTTRILTDASVFSSHFLFSHMFLQSPSFFSHMLCLSPSSSPNFSFPRLPFLSFSFSIAFFSYILLFLSSSFVSHSPYLTFSVFDFHSHLLFLLHSPSLTVSVSRPSHLKIPCGQKMARAALSRR